MIKSAGFIKTTLINYPGKVAAALFLPGCDLRCPYCHNPELVMNTADDLVDIDGILAYLKKRQGLLQGVCISGGEPLVHQDLGELVKAIKGLGYLVKIDTNGTFPDRILGLEPDFIAMDIKTVPEKYPMLSPVQDPLLPEKIKASIEIIKKSGIEHEFRTTVAPGIVDRKDIQNICQLLSGAQCYVLAGYVPGHTLDPNFTQDTYTDQELHQMADIVRAAGIPLPLRNMD
ncbi:MAG: anaerobic ribonucleoside-triphosphate reductase activating protein [Spirochaetia bacterium]|nr:anaerobic ribonucleoside-triphosphate reductase activating protein [Spirochaetia bacterium]